MDEKYKKVIIQNIPNLIHIQNFQDVRDQLVHFGVYNQSMVDYLLAPELPVKEQQAQKLFLDLQTRGPKTFEFLVEALVVTGNTSIAYKLLGAAAERMEIILTQSQECQLPSRIVFSHHPPEEDEVDTSSNSNFSGFPPLKKFKSSANSISEDETERESITSCCSVPTSDDESPPSPTFLSHSPISFQLCSSGSPVAKINVKTARKLYNGSKDLSDVYVMESHPRGLALVINNMEFRGDPGAKRRGAEYDSVNLNELFKRLGCEVTLAENVTKQGLLNRDDGVLENFMAKFNTTKADCCFVSLNSHGFNRDLIRMSDPPRGDDADTAVDLILDIIRRFNNKNFPAFQGKPKVFLVNACRGGEYNRPVRKSLEQQESRRIQSDGEKLMSLEDELGSEYSDIFVLRSTVPEYVSMRDLDRGAWFVECLCTAFSQFADELHFADLKCKVSSLMEKMYDASFGKQSIHYEEYGITKRLYFNPGL